jgi:hypothetical protein
MQRLEEAWRTGLQFVCASFLLYALVFSYLSGNLEELKGIVLAYFYLILLLASVVYLELFSALIWYGANLRKGTFKSETEEEHPLGRRK